MGARNIFSGRVSSVDASVVTVACPGIGEIKANVPPGSKPLAPGVEVSLCIRPEEIIIIRPDRVLDDRVQDNIIEGRIESAAGRGSTQILFLRAGGEAASGTLLKIELPNFVVKKLALATGKRIRVSLKKENVWIIPQ
jgi:ABC-type Fe3+/spermidine/putrescine transport system ATPase subunit